MQQLDCWPTADRAGAAEFITISCCLIRISPDSAPASSLDSRLSTSTGRRCCPVLSSESAVTPTHKKNYFVGSCSQSLSANDCSSRATDYAIECSSYYLSISNQIL